MVPVVRRLFTAAFYKIGLRYIICTLYFSVLIVVYALELFSLSYLVRRKCFNLWVSAYDS